VAQAPLTWLAGTLLGLWTTSVLAVEDQATGLAWSAYLQNESGNPPGYTFPHASCFRAAASAHGVPETLLLAVARGESDFDSLAQSKANAHGVMQIQWPGTAQHLGIDRLSLLYDPCTNIDAGARYLRELLDQYDGNLHLALAAYNYGPSRIKPDGADIPSGAQWYSAYILRHLRYVLGDGSVIAPDRLYSELGRTTLVTFGEPYRAAAFVDSLERRVSGLHLDWFRKDVGHFAVVLSYADRDGFEKGAELLARAGFTLQ
jgi:hypothetical protein